MLSYESHAPLSEALHCSVSRDAGDSKADVEHRKNGGREEVKQDVYVYISIEPPFIWYDYLYSSAFLELKTTESCPSIFRNSS